jgi:hypothetical protein
MWFVPTHNFNDTTAPPAIPPFVVYNTALPFDAASSWTTYANHGYPTGKSVWLTGCAYDPVSNTAWASAYGVPLTANTIEPPYNMELHEQSASTSNYTISIKGGISINGGIVIQ